MAMHGLVIGKFYPPHKGHAHLILEAEKQTNGFLFVIVLGNRFESISVDQRVSWLQEEFKGRHGGTSNIKIIGMPNDCPEDYDSEEIWFAQVELMRHALKATGCRRIDKVFSSEEYGIELADKFDAQHVLIDLDRQAFHISGTAVRDDLDKNWQMIIPPARQELATRIIVLGAESSGTTTLSRALVDHYWEKFPSIKDVPEFGRTYTESWLKSLQAINPDATMDDLKWSVGDFDAITKVQQSMENNAATVSPLVIADTDALATSVWQERYTGKERTYTPLPKRDLYIITDHQGVDFHDDGFRDGEHLREKMTEQFKTLLTSKGFSWVLVTGDHERRMTTATAVIDQIIEQNFSFTSPTWATSTVL